MSLTALQLIKASMRVAQVLAKGEEPDTDEANDALEAMGIMLHSWSARSLLVRANTQEDFALVPGTSEYTIGVGGDFNTSKPIAIKSAFIRDSNGVDLPVDVVGRDVYDSFQDKAISESTPLILCYDPGAAQQASQLGTVLLYYIPDNTNSYTLYITSQKPFTDITTLSETLTFEPQYEEPIKYELAIRLWREYHGASKPIPQDIIQLANEAMHVLETTNSVQLVSGLDLPGMKGGGMYNIYTGGYNG